MCHVVHFAIGHAICVMSQVKICPIHFLNKIANQATHYMAADKETIVLSRILMYCSKCNPPGSSVGRMPDSQSREPGFESPLLPFRSLGIFFHFTTPQSTQLYK